MHVPITKPGQRVSGINSTVGLQVGCSEIGGYNGNAAWPSLECMVY